MPRGRARARGRGGGRSFYDDNYGEYSMEGEEDFQFYLDVQKNSVRKKCKGCGRVVRILPDYAYCNSCCVRLEHGHDLG